jgi:hypothetical protein
VGAGPSAVVDGEGVWGGGVEVAKLGARSSSGVMVKVEVEAWDPKV